MKYNKILCSNCRVDPPVCWEDFFRLRFQLTQNILSKVKQSMWCFGVGKFHFINLVQSDFVIYSFFESYLNLNDLL